MVYELLLILLLIVLFMVSFCSFINKLRSTYQEARQAAAVTDASHVSLADIYINCPTYVNGSVVSDDFSGVFPDSPAPVAPPPPYSEFIEAPPLYEDAIKIENAAATGARCHVTTEHERERR